MKTLWSPVVWTLTYSRRSVVVDEQRKKGPLFLLLLNYREPGKGYMESPAYNR